MGGTGREGFASPLIWGYSKDGGYDVAVGETDGDNTEPQNTATTAEHNYLINGCIWGGEG